MSQITVLSTREMQGQLKASTEGLPLCGWFVYWSITNVKALRDVLVQQVSALGLDADAVLPIRTKTAFISAVKDVAHAHNATHKSVLDNSERTVYVIVSTHVDPTNIDVTFTVETKVVYNKYDEQITVHGPFEDEIRALYEDYKVNYYSDQFRDMILRLLRKHCQFLTIRDRGGIYFVPVSSEQSLNQIKSLFASYPECSFDTVGVANQAEAKKSMWRTLIGEVSTEIQSMRDELAALPPDLPESGLQARLERYQALREKVENYELVLSGTAQNLKDELSALSSHIMTRIAA